MMIRRGNVLQQGPCLRLRQARGGGLRGAPDRRGFRRRQPRAAPARTCASSVSIQSTDAAAAAFGVGSALLVSPEDCQVGAQCFSSACPL